MIRPSVLLTALALLVAACGPASSTAFVASELGTGEDGWRGIPIELDRTLPEVTLTATDGTEVDLASDPLGTPTLLFFGYANCPDICPIHLGTIASAMRTIGVSPRDVQVIFVSVDPERDSPADIERFVGAFDARFLGLHGDLATVEDALAQLDLPGPVVEGPDPRGDGDLIGHPAQVIGFDADGVAQRVWPFGARRADWIDDLPLILADWTRADAELESDVPAGTGG